VQEENLNIAVSFKQRPALCTWTYSLA